jgi:hypothetical protein
MPSRHQIDQAAVYLHQQRVRPVPTQGFYIDSIHSDERYLVALAQDDDGWHYTCTCNHGRFRGHDTGEMCTHIIAALGKSMGIDSPDKTALTSIAAHRNWS